VSGHFASGCLSTPSLSLPTPKEALQ
jgi:hypothetical protein